MLERLLELHGTTLLLYSVAMTIIVAVAAGLLITWSRNRTAPRRQRKLRWVHRRDLNWLRAMTPGQFELTVCKTFRRNHYAIQEVTRDPSGTGFVLMLHLNDVPSVALCHYYGTQKVAAEEIEQAIKMRDQFELATVFVVAVSGFSREARALHTDPSIKLVDCAGFLSMVDGGKRASYRRRSRYLPKDSQPVT